MALLAKTRGTKSNQPTTGVKHDMKAIAATFILVLLSGCTSVAYVENGAVNGSQCKNTVRIDDTGLQAVSMCSGGSSEE